MCFTQCRGWRCVGTARRCNSSQFALLLAPLRMWLLWLAVRGRRSGCGAHMAQGQMR